MSDGIDYSYEHNQPCEWHQSVAACPDRGGDALAAMQPPMPDPDLAVRVTERLQQRVAELEAQLEAASQPGREWIPIGERLPEPGTRTELLIDAVAGNKTFLAASGRLYPHLDEVKAWRPLPAQGQAQGEG